MFEPLLLFVWWVRLLQSLLQFLLSSSGSASVWQSR
jgi:hypothetical protein